MRKLKNGIDRKAFEAIYLSFIRPVLEYADVLWDNCTQQEKQELEKIPIEAARISCGIIVLNKKNKNLRKFQLKQPGFLLGQQNWYLFKNYMTKSAGKH